MSQKLGADRNIGNAPRTIRKPKKLTQMQAVEHLQAQGIDIYRSIYSQIECGTYNIRINELDELVALFEGEIFNLQRGLKQWTENLRFY